MKIVFQHQHDLTPIESVQPVNPLDCISLDHASPLPRHALSASLGTQLSRVLNQNTIRNVVIVVTVLMTNSQESLNSNTGHAIADVWRLHISERVIEHDGQIETINGEGRARVQGSVVTHLGFFQLPIVMMQKTQIQIFLYFHNGVALTWDYSGLPRCRNPMRALLLSGWR